ncbi:MAG: retropepsin-like aspartic protease [Smithella sp.]
MKKISFLIDFKCLTLLLVLSFVLFIPMLGYAGTFYNCIDNDGNETLSDVPVYGQTCKPMETYDETRSTQGENKNVAHQDNRITKIIVSRNQIFVPATIAYDREEVNVNLLLDTGATRTTINTEIADRLYMRLSKARKAKGQVVGGGIIEANIVKVDSFKVGPHTFHNQDIFIVPHEGRAVKFDGLLGMDVLGALSYRIDLAKQVIIWE